MKLKLPGCIAMFICISLNAFARGNAMHFCAAEKQQQGISANKATIATPEEDYYDVKYVKFNIELSNLNTTVSGDVTTTAVTNVANFGTYAFELDSLIIIDSFKLNNQLQLVISNGKVRRVTMPVPMAQGVPFTVQVFYHGTAPAGTGAFFTGGLNHVQLPSGTHIMYSESDPDFADDWWPCKQSIQDKIDSVDMWVTVPSACKVGSNGLLKQVTSMPGSKLRYEWKTQYPIAYYLISVAVAPYAERNYYMHFTDGSNDSMLIQNFVYDSATYMNAANAAALDSTGVIVDYLSTLYGKYPFYKEKYGHCIAEPLGGGMEHQTMTTLAYALTTLISHEMGHQWFGDHVTYGTWADIWLSEGFATYTEQLFVEHFWGAQAVYNYRTGVFNNVMTGPGNAGGSVYVDDTTNVNRIFNSRLTYSKGAAVAHMLRYLAPADSLYFKALRQYQQQYASGIAITADLQNVFEQVYGQDLDSFFNQWVYREGYPTYGGKYYQQGNQVYLHLDQTTSKPSSVPVFWMPVQLRLKSAAGDTIVSVFNDKASQTYVMTWDKSITGFDIDPNNHIVNKTATVSQDASIMSVENIVSNPVQVFPNPATDRWFVMNIPDHSLLVLTDMAGKVLWQQTASHEATVPAEQLARGNYILSIIVQGNKSNYYRLVK